jgi:flagellar protein FlaJ
MKRISIDKKLLMLIVIGSIVTLTIILVNHFYLLPLTKDTAPILYPSINIVSGFIFALPIILVKYLEYSRRKEVEELFPVFLRDFVESVRGGLTVPTAVKAVSGNDYKALTPYIRKMAAQMNWGISAERVLLKFSKEAKSKLIGRIVSSVIESHRFGGNLAETFEALSKTSLEVEKLRAERRLYLNSQLITGYIIFFVFLAVIIGLERFLTPSLAQVSPGSLLKGGAEAGNQEYLITFYREVYRNLILIQGFFAGLAVGKMAEGSLISGVKHSIFMMFSGFLIFTVSVWFV